MYQILLYVQIFTAGSELLPLAKPEGASLSLVLTCEDSQGCGDCYLM
jgi:hypothetical protein